MSKQATCHIDCLVLFCDILPILTIPVQYKFFALREFMAHFNIDENKTRHGSNDLFCRDRFVIPQDLITSKFRDLIIPVTYNLVHSMLYRLFI